MKKVLSLLLVLAFLIIGIPSAIAEEPSDRKLTINSPEYTILNKFKLNIAAEIGMSDVSVLPTDLKLKLKNTKYATINKAGVITAKKAGTVTFTASSKSLSSSVTAKITVKPNVFNETRSVEQLMQQLDNVNPATHHGVMGYDRKMYFKNGKLTVDLYIYNRFGYPVVKLYALKQELWDTATNTRLAKYSKKTISTKKLKNGNHLKFTYSFSPKGLDKKYDLTQLGANGLPAQLEIRVPAEEEYGMWFIYDGPEDPWGDWDDDEDYDDYDDMSIRGKGVRF